jgi:hypothetical protein
MVHTVFVTVHSKARGIDFSSDSDGVLKIRDECPKIIDKTFPVCMVAEK